LQITESLQTEYKSNFNDTVIETLTAFANTKGGKVIIGVDNSGNPLKNFSVVQKWVNEVKNKTRPSIIPDIEAVIYEGHTVIEMSMNEFPIKPIAFKGRYYKRVENSNHQLSLGEITHLHLKTFNNSWDSYITNDYTPESISIEKVNRFIDKANKLKENPIADDPLTVLYKYELIKESQLTNACHLLFSDKEVFQATIEMGRFSAPTLIKDAQTLRSDLFSEVEKVLQFIKKHINKEYIITGGAQRQERWQYPMDAIREIVINMIVHRDYMHHGDSSIKIFNNSIEFFNPGTLPSSISVEQLISGHYISEARNKKIATIFKEAGEIEKYGSGIQRIINSFDNSNLKTPLFENFQHGFRVVVFSDLTEKVGEKVGGKLTNNQQSILNMMHSSPYISANELSVKIGISSRKIEENIKKLKEAGIIKRVGAAKGGHWEIINKA